MLFHALILFLDRGFFLKVIKFMIEFLSFVLISGVKIPPCFERIQGFILFAILIVFIFGRLFHHS